MTCVQLYRRELFLQKRMHVWIYLLQNLEYFMGQCTLTFPQPVSSTSISALPFLHFPGSFLRASEESACAGCCHLWVTCVGGQELSRKPSCFCYWSYIEFWSIFCSGGCRNQLSASFTMDSLCERTEWPCTKNNSLTLKCSESFVDRWKSVWLGQV